MPARHLPGPGFPDDFQGLGGLSGGSAYVLAPDGVAIHGRVVPGGQVGSGQDGPGQGSAGGLENGHLLLFQGVGMEKNPLNGFFYREPIRGPHFELGHEGGRGSEAEAGAECEGRPAYPFLLSHALEGPGRIPESPGGLQTPQGE